MRATPGVSVGDLRGRAWHSVRFLLVGCASALVLGVVVSYVTPGLGLATEDGPILILLMALPLSVAASVEWWSDGRAQRAAARACPPTAGSSDGE